METVGNNDSNRAWRNVGETGFEELLILVPPSDEGIEDFKTFAQSMHKRLRSRNVAPYDTASRGSVARRPGQRSDGIRNIIHDMEVGESVTAYVAANDASREYPLLMFVQREDRLWQFVKVHQDYVPQGLMVEIGEKNKTVNVNVQFLSSADDRAKFQKIVQWIDGPKTNDRYSITEQNPQSSVDDKDPKMFHILKKCATKQGMDSSDIASFYFYKMNDVCHVNPSFWSSSKNMEFTVTPQEYRDTVNELLQLPPSQEDGISHPDNIDFFPLELNGLFRSAYTVKTQRRTKMVNSLSCPAEILDILDEQNDKMSKNRCFIRATFKLTVPKEQSLEKIKKDEEKQTPPPSFAHANFSGVITRFKEPEDPNHSDYLNYPDKPGYHFRDKHENIITLLASNTQLSSIVNGESEARTASEKITRLKKVNDFLAGADKFFVRFQNNVLREIRPLARTPFSSSATPSSSKNNFSR